MHACRLAESSASARWWCRGPRAWRRRSGWSAPTSGAEWRRPFAADLDTLDATALRSAASTSSSSGRATEIGPDGDDATFVVERFVGMRVRGQVHALEIPVAARRDGAVVDALRAGFVEHYVAAYGVAPASRLQLTAARVRVVRRAAARLAGADSPEPDPRGCDARPVTRAAYFAELGGFVTTPVFDWIGLAPGDRLRGPPSSRGPTRPWWCRPTGRRRSTGGRNVVLAR